MKIINNLFDKLVEFITTNNIGISSILAVTNMSICHIKDNSFLASFKIYTINKDLNLDTRITCNSVRSHYEYNTTGKNCVLGIAKVTVNELLEIESLNIFNEEINDAFATKFNNELINSLLDKYNYVDFRISKINNNLFLLCGNDGRNTHLYTYDYNKLIRIHDMWHKNRPIFVDNNNIYVADFYESRQSIEKYIFQDNNIIKEYERNEYKQNNYIYHNIWITDGNLADVSGSSNIININDRYFCIFHKLTVPGYNCEEVWTKENQEMFKITSKHPNHYVIYFSYFAELLFTSDGFRFKSISCPIYIKKDCFNGIHFVCGLTYNDGKIYISYGINDLDSGILILSFDEFNNIINTNNNEKQILFIDNDIQQIEIM